MASLKLQVQTFVLLTLRNQLITAGHYSTKMITKDEALKGKNEVNQVLHITIDQVFVLT